MTRTYPIYEFESFVRGKHTDKYKYLPENVFDKLESFILENKGKQDASEFMSISIKPGLGTVITAQNYVGIIALKDGSIIEILPKIFKEGNSELSADQAKKILLDMLRVLPKSPFKSIQAASMDIARLPLMEVFIKSFLSEVFKIVKHGLKHNYTQFEGNEPFLKGQLIFSEHLKRNFAHKERNYIRYDVFNIDTPENRVLKSALILLYKKSSSNENKRDIKILLSAFEGVPASKDYRIDISKCSNSRDSKYYRTALIWAEVFLTGKSFTSYTGSTVAFALLYPMETLFESYVAHMLKLHLNRSLYSVTVQETEISLFDEPRKFFLKPDIVVRNKDNSIFILDTKWKLLTKDKNYGITQADMYQMYAYHKKYNAENVTLIYPKSPYLDNNEDIVYKTAGDAEIRVRFFDFFNADSSLDIIEQAFI